MDTDLDTLATALYVRVDDALRDHGSGAVATRDRVGAEAVRCRAGDGRGEQSLLGFTSETRWLRHGRRHLIGMFPYLPAQSGYNKRLRKAAGLLQAMIRVLATGRRRGARPCWLIDSTPV